MTKNEYINLLKNFYIKSFIFKDVQHPGILTINVNINSENLNEHFHSADIVVPEGLARTAHNANKAFYANWERFQLVDAEDLRNFRINVHCLLANKPDALIHPMHTVWFKNKRQLKQFYKSGKAMIFIRENKMPDLDFLDHSAGLTASGMFYDKR